MSTRGIYQFTHGNESYCVYKHCDNYPEGEHGGFSAIAAAAKLAWPLPRFEADEFAASFVAANKGERGGEVRLTNEGSWEHAASGDCEYAYIIEARGNNTFGCAATVTCLAIAMDESTGQWNAAPVFVRELSEIIAGWRPARKAA